MGGHFGAVGVVCCRTSAGRRIEIHQVKSRASVMSTWRRPHTRTYACNQAAVTESYVSARETVDALDKRSLRTAFNAKKEKKEQSVHAKETSEALQEAKEKLAKLEEKAYPKTTPLYKKHPYYYPVEHVFSAPHESSIWPENRPHFDLVSSYDVMVGYLGLRPQDREPAAATEKTAE